MARKKVKKKGVSAKTKAGVLVGAFAAGAAAAHYFYGPQGSKHRTQIKSWSLKAKSEVMSQLEKLPEVDKKTYHKLVADMTSKYKKLPSLESAEVDKLAKELKKGWAHVERQLKPKVKKSTKKTTRKKSTKKIASKK